MARRFDKRGERQLTRSSSRPVAIIQTLTDVLDLTAVTLATGARTPLRMLVKPAVDRFFSAMVAAHRIWEARNTALVSALLDAGDHFVDVGAHLGYYSLIAAERVGARGRVWAFEPEPENHRLCQLNVALNALEDRIAIHRLAIGDRNQSPRLFRVRDNHGAHQLAQPYWDGHDATGLGVDATSLDGFARSDPAMARIDLVKIDVQGYEVKALLGMRGLIAANRERLLVLAELQPFLLRTFEDDGAGWTGFLELLGEETTTVYLVEQNPRVFPEVRAVTADELDAMARELLRHAEVLDVYRDVGLEVLLAFSATGAERLESKSPFKT